MAESEMMITGSPAAVGHGRGGMGILRLLRQWPAAHVAAGGRSDPWPDPAYQPVPREPEQAPAPSPQLVLDRRATSLALRETIDEWRAAQRDLEGLPVGTRERAQAQANVDLLRRRHHRLFTQLRAYRQIAEV